jgi:hypothetical protein
MNPIKQDLQLDEQRSGWLDLVLPLSLVDARHREALGLLPSF